MIRPRRRDYVNDPNAPTPNSLKPSACLFVRNEEGRVLLIKRSDNGDWALPGGTQEMGESIEETARREAEEETGYLCDITGLVGLYTNPAHLIEYADGEVRQQFSVCFRGHIIGGSVRANDEATDIKWIPIEKIDSLPMNPSMRLRVEHGLSSKSPYLG